MLLDQNATGTLEQPMMRVAAQLLGDAGWLEGTEVGPYRIVKGIGVKGSVSKTLLPRSRDRQP